jgi:hypothetical protein
LFIYFSFPRFGLNFGERRAPGFERACGALYAVPATLAVFTWSSPADPVKVHDVFLAAFWAYAFDLALVVVESGVGIVIHAEGLRVFVRFFRDAAFDRLHFQPLPMVTAAEGRIK